MKRIEELLLRGVRIAAPASVEASPTITARSIRPPAASTAKIRWRGSGLGAGAESAPTTASKNRARSSFSRIGVDSPVSLLVHTASLAPAAFIWARHSTTPG